MITVDVHIISLRDSSLTSATYSLWRAGPHHSLYSRFHHDHTSVSGSKTGHCGLKQASHSCSLLNRRKPTTTAHSTSSSQSNSYSASGDQLPRFSVLSGGSFENPTYLRTLGPRQTRTVIPLKFQAPNL